jgi:F-type H+-transporting ATPase subunit delta
MAAVAAHYARALAGVVLESKLDLPAIDRQIEDFSRTLQGSKDLREVLENPALPLDKRIAILDAVNRRVGCDAKVRNFLALLIEHGRLPLLDEILEQYRAEINRLLGISEAEVITARPLGDEERDQFETRVAGLSGAAKSDLRATFREDPSLIGGAIVRIGSTIYDGSVRGRLDRLKERLLAVQ